MLQEYPGQSFSQGTVQVIGIAPGGTWRPPAQQANATIEPTAPVNAKSWPTNVLVASLAGRRKADGNEADSEAIAGRLVWSFCEDRNHDCGGRHVANLDHISRDFSEEPEQAYFEKISSNAGKL